MLGLVPGGSCSEPLMLSCFAWAADHQGQLLLRTSPDLARGPEASPQPSWQVLSLQERLMSDA